MHQKPKAIILDLDGTLLRSDKTISKHTLDVLEQCKSAGILVIVATARFWFKAEKYLEMIKPDYAILADGTQIYRKDEMIHGFTMDEFAVKGLIQSLKVQNPSSEFVVGVGKELLCSATDIDEKWRSSYAFEEELKQSAYKIAAMLETPKVAEKLAAHYGFRLYSYRDECLYGFTSKESGKYQAVRALGELLGIGLQDIVAFGDDENDYEILKHCGIGVAVSNAISQILEVADEVTGSNDEDGVADYLERYYVCEELVPFWEETYQDMNIITFSEDPNANIKEMEHLFNKDWEILQFKSYVFEDEHPNVPKHLHASNKIVARRIR